MESAFEPRSESQRSYYALPAGSASERLSGTIQQYQQLLLVTRSFTSINLDPKARCMLALGCRLGVGGVGMGMINS